MSDPVVQAVETSVVDDELYTSEQLEQVMHDEAPKVNLAKAFQEDWINDWLIPQPLRHSRYKTYPTDPVQCMRA